MAFKPKFEESAVISRTCYSLRVRHDLSLAKTVEVARVAIQFDPKGKVTVVGSKETILFTAAFAIGIEEKSNVSFKFDFIGGIETLIGATEVILEYDRIWYRMNPKAIAAFKYGPTLFLIDTENSLVGVWAPWFKYEFAGWVGIGDPIPRPRILINDYRGRQLQL